MDISLPIRAAAPAITVSMSDRRSEETLKALRAIQARTPNKWRTFDFKTV